MGGRSWAHTGAAYSSLLCAIDTSSLFFTAPGPPILGTILATATATFIALLLASRMYAVKERRGSKVTSKYLSTLPTQTA